MQMPRVRSSVRVLMTLVLVVGVGFGWFVRRARIQRDAVAAIKHAGGSVLYDWQFQKGRFNPNGKPSGPAWLAECIGADYFDNVIKVNLRNVGSDAVLSHVGQLARLDRLGLIYSKVSDNGMHSLKGLSGLKSLDLGGTDISDAGLGQLEALTNLEYLGLIRTRVSDSGMIYLKGMTKLRTVYLDSTQVSDEGLVHLKGLTRLKLATFSGTKVTDRGVRELKQALPKAHVTIGF
jgi:Leucine Rich repeat